MKHNRIQQGFAYILAVIVMIQLTPLALAGTGNGEGQSTQASTATQQSPEAGQLEEPVRSDEPDENANGNEPEQPQTEEPEGEAGNKEPESQDPESQDPESQDPESEDSESEDPESKEPELPQTAEPTEKGPEQGTQPAESEETPFTLLALEQLLTELAGGQAEENTKLINWVLQGDFFVQGTLEKIYRALQENPQRSESFFAVTKELWEQLKNEKTISSHESIDERGLENILAAAKELEQRLEGTQEYEPSQEEDDTASIITVPEGDTYLRWMSKGAVPTLNEEEQEIYRHYTVRMGFEAEAVREPTMAADIVLVIDNSRSTAEKLPAIKTAAVYFASQPVVYESGSSIAVVTFSDIGQTVLELTDAAGEDDGPNQEILDAIRWIEPDSSTNLQSGVLEARRVLGMEAGDIIYDEQEEDRARAVILFTDGAANSRYTDIWRYDILFEGIEARWAPDIDAQESTQATQEGFRRWSRLTPDEQGMERAEVDGNPMQMNGVSGYSREDADATARLEAQYLVSQGVELYTVSYGTDRNNYISSLTWSLEGEPDESMSGKVPSSKEYKGKRSYSATDVEALDEVAGAIVRQRVGGLPGFILTDTLSDGFEFADESFSVTDAEGSNLEADEAWDVRFENSAVVWRMPEGLESGSYFLDCRIRVKDDPEQPLAHFADGGTTEIGKAELSYYGGRYVFASPEVEVAALPEATVQDTYVFAGETVALGGAITRGTGRYTYRWYDAAQEPLNEETVIEGMQPDTGIPPLETFVTEEGEHLFYLEVTDIAAFAAGYSAGKMRLPMKVTAVGASLTIEIIGSDGELPDMPFETTILKGQDGHPNECYHFLGMGSKRFDTATGLTRGVYDISTYTPYGYRVKDGDSQVVISPQIDENGVWAPCDKTLTIVVEKTLPRFFYRWV